MSSETQTHQEVQEKESLFPAVSLSSSITTEKEEEVEIEIEMASLSRFQGCLLGVLIGDCLGAPFEGNRIVAKAHLNKYFKQLLDPNLRLPFKPFTDDTAMTKSVALSLIENKGQFEAQDMAKRFVTEFVKEPKRGYGASIGDVFYNLRVSSFEDPFGPASRQFGGMGSYGNGAAMRISPVALLTHASKGTEDLVNLVTDTSRLTHSNKLGIRGAIMQALAVKGALKEDKESSSIDVFKFVDGIIEEMKVLEGKDEKVDNANLGGIGLPDESSDPRNLYGRKLKIVKTFLEKKDPPIQDDVDEQLGVHVSAHRSVPTALYCFLLACRSGGIPEVETDNLFQRTIQYAFSLGGDTDTIGSMAGAIAGAYTGVEGIPGPLLSRVEGADEVLKWAEALYNVTKERLKERTACEQK